MPLTKVTKSLITSVDVSQINTTEADAGKVLTSDGSTLNWVASSSIGSTGITQGTAVTLTTQTSATFTGIPSTAKRITVVFNGVSTSGSSIPLFRLGAGSLTSTGYNASGWSSSGSGNSTTTNTTGFIMSDGTATNRVFYGTFNFINIDSNTWVHQGSSSSPATGHMTNSHGSIALASSLDRVMLTTVNGTDTFDAGTINIMWE